MKPTLAAALIGLGLVLVGAGCGNDSSATAGDSQPASPSTTAPTDSPNWRDLVPEEFHDHFPHGLIPDGLEIPDVPEIPDGLEIPDVPEIPDGLEIPDVPEIPDGLEIPDVPEIPDGFEIPSLPESARDAIADGLFGRGLDRTSASCLADQISSYAGLGALLTEENRADPNFTSCGLTFDEIVTLVDGE